MFPVRHLMKNLCIDFKNPHYEYIVVRWRIGRKPFWWPIAKTKKFVPPKVGETDPYEKPEIDRLFELYHRHYTSLKAFMAKDESFSIDESVGKYVLSEESIKESYERNDAWNLKSAELREKRLQEHRLKLEEDAFLEMQRQDDEKEAMKAKMRILVQLELEKSKSYITPDNIDKRIHQCLESTVSHNFAIDLNGNIYKDRKIVDSFNKDQNEKVSQEN